MEVLRARESGRFIALTNHLELSDKLKEAERMRQQNEALKKTLADKEADLAEREREIEEKRKRIDQQEITRQLRRYKEQATSHADELKAAKAAQDALTQQVQQSCERAKAKSAELQSAMSKITALQTEKTNAQNLATAAQKTAEEQEIHIIRLEQEVEAFKELQKKLESEGSGGDSNAASEERAEKLESKLSQMKALLAEKVQAICDKDEIIAKHESAILQYETELQQLARGGGGASTSKPQQLFPTSPQVEALPAESERFQEKEQEQEEESQEPVEEILYIKFDIQVLEADDSEHLAEVKEAARELRDEKASMLEILKQERERRAEVEDALLEREKEREQQQQEMRDFHAMLRHKEQEFASWRIKIDELEHYSREMEVKLARTEATLKIALQKYNEAAHRVKVLESQIKDQEMHEGQLNEKLSALTKHKHKLEAGLDEIQKKARQSGAKINYLENFIYQQKEELSNKESILYKMQQQSEDQKSMLKSTELRLRQLSVTKVKDWQRKFDRIEKEKGQLEERLRAMRLDQQVKEAEMVKLQRRLTRAQRSLGAERSDRTEMVSTSPSRSDHTKSNERLRKINEVEEILETTNTLKKKPSHESLPDIHKKNRSVRVSPGERVKTYQAGQYETPPVKKSPTLLTPQTQREKRLLPSAMHRQIFKRISRGGPKAVTPEMEEKEESPSPESVGGPGHGAGTGPAQRDSSDTISRFSDIRAARLRKAGESPYWRKQIDDQYEDYMSSLGRSNNKNASMGLRKALFQPGEDGAPVVFDSAYMARFKPS